MVERAKEARRKEEIDRGRGRGRDNKKAIIQYSKHTDRKETTDKAAITTTTAKNIYIR